MTAENNEPSIYLEGGTISGCTASTKGSAIFMLRGTAGLPKITLGGDIFVDPENDVYTSSSINILLNNVLTTQNEKAILISYNYNTISTGSKLLKLAEYPYDNEAVSKSHDKVAVRIEQADSTYKTNYYFSDQGALLEQN